MLFKILFFVLALEKPAFSQVPGGVPRPPPPINESDYEEEDEEDMEEDEEPPEVLSRPPPPLPPNIGGTPNNPGSSMSFQSPANSGKGFTAKTPSTAVKFKLLDGEFWEAGKKRGRGDRNAR